MLAINVFIMYQTVPLANEISFWVSIHSYYVITDLEWFRQREDLDVYIYIYTLHRVDMYSKSSCRDVHNNLFTGQ